VPLGLGSVVLENPVVLKALHWGGAAVLLWLSWKIATSRALDSSSGGNPVGFAGAAVFQLVNPKSWLVSASAAGTFLSTEGGSPVIQSAFLGGLFVLGGLPSCFVWLAFGATLQRVLDSSRRLRAFNLVMGVLLALSILLIV
jgi:threonine/homoserine/homoserine lactone efflux protein